MQRITISLPSTLYDTFRDRANYNRRSMSSEITFTLEAALAMESDVNLSMIRALTGSQEDIRTERTGSTEHPPAQQD